MNTPLFTVRASCLAALLGLLNLTGAGAATVTVNVGANGSLMFLPASINVNAGDTVQWVWKGSNHSVTSGTQIR